MPTIDLTDNEYAAVTAAIRRAIEDDRFPRAPRLDPLRAALARLEAAAAVRRDLASNGAPSSKKPAIPETTKPPLRHLAHPRRPRRPAKPTSGQGDNRRDLAAKQLDA